jgi:hypothetical protein
MSAVLTNNVLTVTFEDDSWKTEQPTIITNVADTGLGFYSANTFTYDDKNVLRSGVIGNNNTSQTVITFNLTVDGEIEFNYKVSSESNYDWFYVLIDDVQVVKVSGTVDFTVYTQILTAGEHTLTLKYTKDSSNGVGSDCGAIGYLKLTGVETPLISKFLILINNVVYSFDGTALTTTDLIYSDLTADNFISYGFNDISESLIDILKSYVNFKILYWQEETEKAIPDYTAIVTGTPIENPVMFFDVDLTGVAGSIKSVEAVYDGSPLLAFSVDGGLTWWGYTDTDGWTETDMYLANVHLLTETVMNNLLGENTAFKVRLTLQADSEVTSLKFNYVEG